MALTAGTVTITAHATTGAPSYAGTGMALSMGQAAVSAFVASGGLGVIPTDGQTSAPFSAARPCTAADVAMAVAARQAFYDAEALRATAYAAGIVADIQANAKAHVTSQVLGRTPSPNDPNTNIQPPSGAVDIPIT